MILTNWIFHNIHILVSSKNVKQEKAKNLCIGFICYCIFIHQISSVCFFFSHSQKNIQCVSHMNCYFGVFYFLSLHFNDEILGDGRTLQFYNIHHCSRIRCEGELVDIPVYRRNPKFTFF